MLSNYFTQLDLSNLGVVTDLGFVAYWRARGWPAQCRSAGATDFACD